MISIERLKKIIHVALAIILLCVGVFGLVLPVLNGIIPIVLGLILLSFQSKYLEHKLEHFARKDHRIEHWYNKLVKFMRHVFKAHS